MSTHASHPAVGSLDPLTLAYLERATGLRGHAAIERWLKYTGFDDHVVLAKEGQRDGKRVLEVRRASIAERLERAHQAALRDLRRPT